MKKLLHGMCLAAFVFAAGCQGTGALVNLQVFGLAPEPDEKHGTLSVTISDFEDIRGDKAEVGRRTHLWGGTTRFTVWNGEIGSGMADATAEYLEKSGWKVLRQRGTQSGALGADIQLTGRVRRLTATAKSGFGFTDLEANAIIEYHVTNNADGSIERITVGSGGTDTEFIYDSEDKDMERLLYDVIQENLDEFLDQTEVKGKTLKRKP